MKDIIPKEVIEQTILVIRGHKVMLDYDLARLYGVSTKVLNQAVKRNKHRFPSDFMLQLTRFEKEKVVTICDHLKTLKFSPRLPYAFTEHGILMLSSVLNNKRAVRVNIQIMRTFVRLRKLIAANRHLAKKIEKMDRKYDYQFKIVFRMIRKILIQEERPKHRIGFVAEQNK